MDQAKVIRVEIDPACIATEDTYNQVKGFLHEELRELKDALAREGGLAMFQMPDWFHRANTTVTKSSPPISETTEFHEKVKADLKEMLKLLESMATMMAAWRPPGTGDKGPEAPKNHVGGNDDEVFYLICSE